jgi:cell wall-associated NlpC family hydrolase
VGIYIGNGQMINAPHTGDVVRIAPVNSNFAGAVRVG